jgi:TolB-like protein/DNA-binding winged helix-turn-helix (wHTH) protein/Tfp pilus assembly protein PilF
MTITAQEAENKSNFPIVGSPLRCIQEYTRLTLMSFPAGSRRVVRFGAFELDIVAHEIRKHGVKLKLHEQPFQVLAALLERPGETITREDLRQKLWPDGTMVAFDQAIATAVNRVRLALGDTAENPRFVETVPRKGYRFIAPVHSPDLVENVAGQDTITAPEVKPDGPVPLRPRRSWIAIATVLSLTVLVTAFFVARKGPPAAIRSIVVLPLANLSEDANQEYLADGITEQLTTELGRMSGLRVVSRTSAWHYKGLSKSLRDIAKELNVEGVIEGSVIRAGTRVRVTAQLIDARTDRHIWAGTFERDLTDILALYDEAGRTIVRELGSNIGSEPRGSPAAPRAINAQAYEHYLKGRLFWNRRTAPDSRKALEHFEEAIALDSSYAPAYAAIADTYALGYLQKPLAETLPPARAAVSKALLLDPMSAEAHAALGLIHFYYDRDWPAAERDLRKAMELNPNYASAPGWYSLFLSWMSRPGECISAARRARELDPVALIIHVQLANCYMWSRQYDEAIKEYQKALDVDPAFWISHSFIGECLENKGLRDQAMAHYVRANPGESIDLLKSIYKERGWAGYWQSRKLVQPPPPPYDMAQISARLGEVDEGLKWLEIARTSQDHNISRTNVDPILDPLRKDPRFAGVLKRIGFQ